VGGGTPFHLVEPLPAAQFVFDRAPDLFAAHIWIAMISIISRRLLAQTQAQQSITYIVNSIFRRRSSLLVGLSVMVLGSGAMLHRSDAASPYMRAERVAPHQNASCTMGCPGETRPT
jgi:hypothetical protein